MKFLVTGGTGFIGLCVARNLIRRGVATVIADQLLDPWAIEGLNREATQRSVDIDTMQMDVGDLASVNDAFTRHPDITHAIHLAYIVGPMVDGDPLLSSRVNILGTTHLFEATVRHKLKRLVFTSSETVHGASQSPYGDRPVTEDDFCNPFTHKFTYAVMKLLNEHMGRRYVERHGARIVCTRPPVVFGHGRKRSAVMWAEHFASKPAIGQPVRLPFPPETRDTWIYKDDCAEQLVRLALKPNLSHFAYNNGGICISAGELAQIVKKFIADARIEFDSAEPGTPLIDNQDGTRLIREIDFAPRSIEQGVQAHINEARKEAGLHTL